MRHCVRASTPPLTVCWTPAPLIWVKKFYLLKNLSPPPLNVKHAIAVSNGSSAVHLALLASGIRPGDEVIVPALTFTATAAAVEWCGASPICADIGRYRLFVAHRLLKKPSLKKRALLFRCIYMVNRRQWMKITAIANAHKIVVIEDTAQAHLARYHGRFCGTLGTAASFSFYPTKNLGACGESGRRHHQ